MKHQKIRQKAQAKPTKKSSSLHKTINIFLGIVAALTVSYISLDYLRTKPATLNSQRTQLANLERAVQSQELREAIKDPSKRQAYLDRIVTNNLPPYCSEVVYDSSGEKLVNYIINLAKSRGIDKTEIAEPIEETRKEIKNGEFDAKTPEIFDFSGEGIKPPIFIGRKLFNGGYEDLAISNCITAHEARHTEQVYKGLGELGYMDKETLLRAVKKGEIPSEVLYGIDEIDAMNYELSALEPAKTNNNYYRNIIKSYRATRSILERTVMLTKGNLHELMIRTLKLNPKR